MVSGIGFTALLGSKSGPWFLAVVLHVNKWVLSPTRFEVAAPSETFGRDGCEPTATGAPRFAGGNGGGLPRAPVSKGFCLLQ